MPETKFCLSGHEMAAWNFGRDMTRPDRLTVYCKPCCRNRTRERREKMKEAGLPVNASFRTVRNVESWVRPVKLLNEDEQAIQAYEAREKEKAEIAMQLREEGRDDLALPFASIASRALFGGAPRLFKPVWEAV